MSVESLRFRTDLSDALAIQAVFNGTAVEAEQKRAMAAIVSRMCATQRDNFDPTNERVTSYLLGRESIAKEIAQYVQQSPGQLETMFNRRKGKPSG